MSFLFWGVLANMETQIMFNMTGANIQIAMGNADDRLRKNAFHTAVPTCNNVNDMTT